METKEVNGGWIIPLLVTVGAAIAYDIISNAPDSVASFKKGFEAGMNR